MRPVPRGARNTRPPRKAARKGMAGTLTLPVGEQAPPLDHRVGAVREGSAVFVQIRLRQDCRC